jgi:hypothetical protein
VNRVNSYSERMKVFSNFMAARFHFGPKGASALLSLICCGDTLARAHDWTSSTDTRTAALCVLKPLRNLRNGYCLVVEHCW